MNGLSTNYKFLPVLAAYHEYILIEKSDNVRVLTAVLENIDFGVVIIIYHRKFVLLLQYLFLYPFCQYYAQCLKLCKHNWLVLTV